MNDAPGPAYFEALDRLYALTRFGEKLDLSAPRALARGLGHPLSAYRSVLVGGTNGKGSTSAMVEALLRGAGIRTGLFTSPHLVSFRERIRVDGALVAPEAVARWTERALAAADAVGVKASFFEVAWAMATGIFAEAGVEVAIWEVGLGGRLDATNVADPVASAVVSVGLDHTHVLGDTLEAIAAEKAAIFREGRPALTAASGPALAAVRGAWPEVQVVDPRPSLASISMPMPGAHQRRNAALALALVEALGVEAAPAHLLKTQWPGRGERLGPFVLDCAHNPPAAEALAAWLADAELGPVDLVLGAMADKDVSGLVAPLAPHVASLHAVTPTYPRRMRAADLAALPKVAALDPQIHGDGGVGETLEAVRALQTGRPILVTGSCFLVGEARAWLTGAEFPEGGILTSAR